MKTTIYLMRHGGVENPNNILYERSDGFPLSQEGRRQVEAVSGQLERDSVAFCEIISSPLLRTRETAEIVAGHRGIDYSTDERLTEWAVGPWANKPVEEFYRDSGYYARPMKTDGLEPHARAAARVIAVMEEAVARCAGKSVLIVSHRESMASAVLSLLKQDFSTIHDLRMPVASVWELVFEDGAFVSARLKFEPLSAA